MILAMIHLRNARYCTIHRVGMFENRVLRRIFGPEREEMAGGTWH
jgi:hypothetical protein